MLRQPAKYNPAFLTEEKLIESFVARHNDLSLITGILRDNIAQPSNQHVLVIGRRGTGKTTLVLRVAAEIERDDDLKRAWYPLVFSEESYQVATPGEFWLEAVFHLGEKTGDEFWKATYRELQGEADENRLRERALSQLMDFADSIGKRLLLIVENLDMLLGDQIGGDHAWSLRHTFSNEPRLMVLATALQWVDEIGGMDKAMFELFKVYELKPLGSDECRAVWAFITGKEISEQRVKPIRILTGGNPRLLTIISTFAANMSFRELMTDIMQLVDDHTEYFKSHLDNLAAVERKVYLALAELWDPSPAREVARMARLDVNNTSSLLRRLVDRGAVEVADGGKRTKYYQLSERMYNIYYLMRRRGAPSSRVQAVVNFMVSFYDEEDLLDVTKCIAAEACGLPPDLREYSYFAYKSIVEKMGRRKLADRFIQEMPPEFFEPSNIPEGFDVKFVSKIGRAPAKGGRKPSAKKDSNQQVELLLQQADGLTKDPEKSREALKLYKKATEIAPDTPDVWTRYGWALQEAGEQDEAESAYRAAIRIAPKAHWAWVLLGHLLHEGLERYDEAEQAYRKAVAIGRRDDLAWVLLGRLLHDKLERYDEAERAYRKAIGIDPHSALAWASLGQVLHERLERYGEAEQAYRKAIGIDPQSALAWAHLGKLLHEKLERYAEAEHAYRKAVEIGPQSALAWASLGKLLHEKLERYDEAEQAYRNAAEIDPQYAWAWAQLGQLLHEKLERFDEAEQAYRKAIEIDPQTAWAWLRLGLLLEDKLEKYDEAEQAYRKAIEVDPQTAWAWLLLGQLLHEKLDRFDEAEQAYRKAIEIAPQYALAWASLGQVLHERLERYGEAEQAYRKAVEIAPQSALAWVHLGKLLHEKLERYGEAEQAYRKAIEIAPQSALAWAHLGKLLHEKLQRYAEAEQAIDKAIEAQPTVSAGWIWLGNFLYKRMNKPDEAENAFRKALAGDSPNLGAISCMAAMHAHNNTPQRIAGLFTEYRDILTGSPSVLNDLAFIYHLSGHEEHLTMAEEWARKAVSMSPSNPSFHLTLASILTAQGKCDQALEQAKQYLRNPDVVRKSVDHATDLMVNLAARGFGEKALDILDGSPAAELLEPLIIGIRLYLGKDVRVATEILEVGKDVAERIERRANLLKNRSKHTVTQRRRRQRGDKEQKSVLPD